MVLFFLFSLGTLDKLHPLIVKLPGPFMQHFAINRSKSSFEQTMVSSRSKCNSDELIKLLQ